MRKTFIEVQEEMIICNELHIYSWYLERTVLIDLYRPANLDVVAELLLINDGQDVRKMNFAKLMQNNQSRSLVCVAIHCSHDRTMEYGTICQADYAGRGAKAGLYSEFIIQELLPFIQDKVPATVVRKSFAGFSLGGLSALDITWNYPLEFSVAAVFSGSLWWRKRSYEEVDYNWNTDRIMHSQVKNGSLRPGMKFFFECGHLDETADRNNNGIIDSVEDTRDLVYELRQLGYTGDDILAIELSDGRHDVATWERAIPAFLDWAYGSPS